MNMSLCHRINRYYRKRYNKPRNASSVGVCDSRVHSFTHSSIYFISCHPFLYLLYITVFVFDSLYTSFFEIRVTLLRKIGNFLFYCDSALLRSKVFQFPYLGLFSFLLLGMSRWRKQQDQSHHQMGHWRSSSYNRKPPLDNWHSTVPSWEKKFCASVGAVPWRKLLESQKYMYLHENVVKWDDSAGKEAFDNAKSRFWADINGLPCNISMPDPNIYIDDVDWNSNVDPGLLLDLERDPTVPGDEERDQEVVILDSSLLMDQSFSCTGWGDAEEATPKPYDMNQSFTPTGWGDAEAAAAKPSDLNQSFSPTGWGDAEEEKPKSSGPVSAAQGWEPNLRENNGVGSWGQYCATDEQNRQNDSWGWNKRSHYGGNRNWGTSDGYNRKRENMTWSRTPTYHGNEYQMNRGGRRNNRGRGRGNFAHLGPYVNKVPTATPW